MLLQELMQPDRATAVAGESQALMRELFPICRSITGAGVRATLDALEKWIPLARSEVRSGTPVFDWEIPLEWNVRDAWIADAHGRRVVDFRDHNLHLVGYSEPVRLAMPLEALQPHLHSLPEAPDLIPYRTSYYRRQWGFCLRHRDRERLEPGIYEVAIDADLAPGHLTYAECIVPGSTSGEAIVYTHTCHPSLANDNLTGIATAAALARALRGAEPRLTWRFVFGPGTIGSLAWLSRNEDRLPRVVGGMVIGLLGDAGPLTYKRSRRGASATDRAAESVLRDASPSSRVVDFEPYGYDERQFCSPGFDLPIGRLTRSPNGAYPEYHTSADDLSLVRPDKLAESIGVLARIVSVLDANRSPISLSPKGEPHLGRRGLYGDLGGAGPGELQHALLWVMSLADGEHDLVSMARRSGVRFETVERAARELERVGLITTVETGPRHTMRSDA